MPLLQRGKFTSTVLSLGSAALNIKSEVPQSCPHTSSSQGSAPKSPFPTLG